MLIRKSEQKSRNIRCLLMLKLSKLLCDRSIHDKSLSRSRVPCLKALNPHVFWNSELFRFQKDNTGINYITFLAGSRTTLSTFTDCYYRSCTATLLGTKIINHLCLARLRSYSNIVNK